MFELHVALNSYWNDAKAYQNFVWKFKKMIYICFSIKTNVYSVFVHLQLDYDAKLFNALFSQFSEVLLFIITIYS